MTRQKLFLLAVVCALGMVLTGQAAATETYTVDLTVGRGSVAGTITTNGTQGAITSFADIVGFDLTLTDAAGNVATCVKGPECGLFGQFGSPSALTATELNGKPVLDWNFNAPRSFMAFQDAEDFGGAFPDGTPPCFQLKSGPVFNCGPSNLPNGLGLVTDESVSLNSSLVGFEENAGVQPFACTAGVRCNPSPVPEPSTTLLWGSGLLLVGIIVRRKQLRARDDLIDVA